MSTNVLQNKTVKSGQKTILFVLFSKSGKWHDYKLVDFKHPQILNQPIFHTSRPVCRRHFNFFDACVVNFKLKFPIEIKMHSIAFLLALKYYNFNWARLLVNRYMFPKMRAFHPCKNGKWQLSFRSNLPQNFHQLSIISRICRYKLSSFGAWRQQ